MVITKRLRGTWHAWHFQFALSLVVKVLCGHFCIACLRPLTRRYSFGGKMNKSTDDPDKNKRKKRKKALTKADLIKALHDQRWDYRTSEGLAKELKVAEKEVKKYLDSEPEIRKSIMKDKYGRSLYTLRKRKSVIGDYWTAFRAVNSAKTGS